MTVSQDYLDHVGDLFGPIGAVTVRRMFGGAGLFRDGLMFALIADDTLYLKVDDRNRPRFEAAGMSPFTYEAGGRRTVMSYWQCPAEVLEDGEALARWATGAFEAARAGKRPARGKRAGGEPAGA